MAENKTFNFTEGEVLLINKPYKWTSFDVVNKVRWLLQRKLGYKKLKVGHAGTLDPLATGLLIICTGKFTKKIEGFQGLPKEYTGTFTLGKTTPSYDLETDFDNSYEVEHIDESLIKEKTKVFIGEIEQVAPLFSAKKIDGERAYLKARRGEEAIMKASKVNVSEFNITDIRMPEVDFQILCSKGTYIRSIAHDYGKALQSGAYLSALCRTKIGEFELSESMQIDVFDLLVNQLISKPNNIAIKE